MTNKKGSGNYYEPHPLDYELLRRMPAEGASLGFHTLGMTIGHATTELNKDQPAEAKLTADIITGRMRSMHVAGLVTKVKLLGVDGNSGWQRTAKGTALYEEKNPGSKLSGGANLEVVRGGKAAS